MHVYWENGTGENFDILKFFGQNLVSYSCVSSLVEPCGLSSVVVGTHNYTSLRF